MRIARFTTGSDPMFGIVQEKDGVDMVYGLTGDPLYTEFQPNGTIEKLDDVRLLAPVIPRSKVVCVGKNYAEHAKEMGSEPPELPLLFLKPNTAVVGPLDPVVLPPGVEELSIEAELAVVIKRVAKNVTAQQARQYILGYTCANDLTDRAAQKSESQWLRAKAFDTSCPLGPWIETDVEPSSLTVSSAVNGQPKQDGSTAHMLHSVPALIEEITSVMTLLPGDVILTGTPAGVAPVSAGDTVDVTVEEIGTLTNRILAAEDLQG